MHIGRIVRSLREQRGLSQPELAQRAGVQQSYLSRLENMNRGFRVDVHALTKLALALDVTLEEIVIQAGIYPTDDLQGDLRWKQLSRVFRTLTNHQQDELLAIAQALHAMTAPLEPRVIGDEQHDQEKGPVVDATS